MVLYPHFSYHTYDSELILDSNSISKRILSFRNSNLQKAFIGVLIQINSSTFCRENGVSGKIDALQVSIFKVQSNESSHCSSPQ